MTRQSSLCEAIESGRIDGFELSNSLETLYIDVKPTDVELRNVLSAIAGRCQREKSFRQDLIDFDVFKPLLKRILSIDLNVIAEIVGTSRDLKLVLNEVGIVDQLVSDLDSSLPDPSCTLCEAICVVNTACNDNKLKFIQRPNILERVLEELTEKTHSGLLKVVCSIITDDDKEGRIPAPVFARENLVASKNLESVVKMVRLHDVQEDVDTVFTIVRELSISQDISKLFALEEHFLQRAFQILTPQQSRKRWYSICRYLRQLSFTDEVKPHVLSYLKAQPLATEAWIETAKSDRVLCSSLFGVSANISIKSPDACRDLITSYPKLISLAHSVLIDSSAVPSQFVACLQFLRCLVKFSEGLDILTQFEPDLEDLRIRIQEKTAVRIIDEITAKLNRDHINDD